MGGKGALLFMALAALLFSGCAAEKPQAGQGAQVSCNKPYIQVGAECCLDENSNSVCDRDEAGKQAPLQCNPPYIQVGTECCLDRDGNSICDRDEPAAAPESGEPRPVPSEEPELPANATIPPAPTWPPAAVPNATANATSIPECEPPRITSAGACCIDEDYDGLCDEAEGMTTTPGMRIEVSLPEAICGDGYCYFGENWSSCAADCGCPAGYVIRNNSCAKFAFMPGTSFTMMEICGNGACKAGAESQSTCCRDCGCPAGQVCSSNVCSNITLAIAPKTMLPVSAFYDNYIVAYIYGMKVHDDTDPFASGELMLLAYSGTNQTAQKVNWPYRIWYSIGSGGTAEQSVPLFALKEGEMGDSLALSITAIDNDQLPSWLDFFLDIADFVTKPVQALLVLVSAVPASIASGEVDTSFGTSMLDAMEGALSGNELIGSISRVYGKSEGWGVRSEPYSEKSGGLTADYEIKKIPVPKKSRLGVRVSNITFSDTGDYFNGEVFIYLRAATVFGEQDLSGAEYRYPSGGAWSLGDNAFIHSGACTPDGTGGCPENPLFSYEANGPFVFLEISAWDEDSPEAGDDHDNIGQASWVIPYDAFDTPPVTSTETYANHIAYPWEVSGKNVTIPISTRGNMKAYIEFYRIEG